MSNVQLQKTRNVDRIDLDFLLLQHDAVTKSELVEILHIIWGPVLILVVRFRHFKLDVEK
jgi:hypothetical protein